MGKVATNTHRDDAIENVPTYEEIVEGANLVFAPLIRERFAEPIRLTRNAEKGGEVLYAIGRGAPGLIVELHNAYGVSRPTSLGSLANHRPYIFDDLDPHVLALLIADDPLA